MFFLKMKSCMVPGETLGNYTSNTQVYEPVSQEIVSASFPSSTRLCEGVWERWCCVKNLSSPLNLFLHVTQKTSQVFFKN